MQSHKHFRSWVSLKRIFLSQCVDHALSLGFAFFLFFIALSFAQSPLLETMSNIGPTFWVSFFSTLFISSLVQRSFFILLFGSTFGNICFHVKPMENIDDRRFWIGHIVESLQLAFPALWMIEILSRSGNSDSARGLRYRFHHS